MKQIVYKIFKGEKSFDAKVPIELDVFNFLDSPIFGINSGVLPNSITRQIDGIQDKYFDVHYDIIYYYLLDSLAIESGDIEDLTVEDYGPDKIIVHVYLNEE